MKNGFTLYIKITTPILFIALIINLYIIKIIEDRELFYRVLSLEGIFLGAFIAGFTHFFGLFSFYKEKKFYIFVNFILLLISSLIFIFNRDIIVSNLTDVREIIVKSIANKEADTDMILWRYFILKYGTMGVLLHQLPSLFIKSISKIELLLKVLSAMIYIFLFSNFFTQHFKISSIALFITLIFTSALFLVIFSDKKTK